MAEDFPEIKNKEKNTKHKSLHWEKFSPHAKHDKQRKNPDQFRFSKISEHQGSRQGSGGAGDLVPEKKNVDYLKTRKRI